MSWPLSQDYNEAIQSPATNFADPELKKGQAVANAMGLPIPFSGNFADVYQVRCPDGSRWAVKCFTREAPGLRERYQEISSWLTKAKLPFSVDFSYLDQGIRIGGKWYPILKMQWVEGLTLNQFVERYLDKPAMLEALLQLWAKMGKFLRAAKVGHCDLQHGNILLVPGSTPNALALKLIDYDGMWIPPLAGKKTGEVGHPNYQHPQRLREGTYSLEVDRFPLLLVATAMRALKADKGLWAKYNNGDNLLFKESDLAAPRQSPLFEELASLPDHGLVMLAAQVRAALKGPLELTALLDDVTPETKAAPSGKLPRTAVAVSPANDALAFDAAGGGGPASLIRKRDLAATVKQEGGMSRIPVAAWVGGVAALVVVAMMVGGVALWAMSGKAPAPETPIVQKAPASVAPDFQGLPNKPNPMVAPAVENPPDDAPGVGPSVAVQEADEPPLPGLPFDSGWDKPVDPDGDCKVLTGKNALTIELPAKDHDLSADRGVMNSPRLLRDAAGDFTAQVQVDGEFAPTPASTASNRFSYLAGGLVLMVDERTYVRVERASMFAPSTKNIRSFPAFDVWSDGKTVPLLTHNGVYPNYGNKRTQLRLARQGDHLTASVSPDDGNWTLIGTVDLHLPTNVKVGVAAISTSSAPFRLRFEGFQLNADKTATAAKPPPQKDKLKPPPTGDDLVKAREAVKQEHKVDNDKLNTPKDRSDLAGKLRAEAFAAKDNPDRQYALLMEARDLAARGEDLPASQRIINETAATFVIDAKEAKEAALLAVGATFSNTAAAKAYLAATAPLLQEARVGDDYDRVKPFLPALRKAAAEAHDAETTKSLAALEKLQKEYEAVKKDLQTLKEKPDDPEANLAVGKFYCFQKQDWENGDPFLAKSGNTALAKTATKDIDGPTEAADQAALADDWFKLADGASPANRPSMLRRAYEWYSKALPNLSSKEETRVKSRLVGLTKQLPDILAAWDNLDVSKVEVIGGSYLRLKPGQVLSTKQAAAGPVEIILTARTAKVPPTFDFLQGNQIVVQWEVEERKITGRRPPEPTNGRPTLIYWQNEKFTFSPNVWVTYSCKLTDVETDTFFGGTQLVFDKFKNDLSKARKVELQARDQILEIKSFTVNSIDNP